MGEAAPIGTLVLTRPVAAAEVRVGDIVTFRSPIAGGRVYTHRVVDIDAGGRLHTQGDINGAEDPAALQSKDLIGKVVARWWGIGWLLRALPFLLVGGLLLWFATRRWALPAHRPAIRVFGSSILVAICAVLLKPFVNFAVVTTVPGDRQATLTLVSTGLFPIRVTATGGAHVDLVDGGIAQLVATGDPGPRGYQFTSAVHFSLLWWIALALIWLAPLLLALLMTPRSDHAAGLAGADAGGPGPGDPGAGSGSTPSAGTHRASGRRTIVGVHRRPVAQSSALRLLAPLVAAVALVAGLVPSSSSAFAAQVSNTGDTAAANPYFTCRAAVTSTVGPSFFAYPLSETTLFTTAADVSGAGRTGTYSLLGSWSSSTARPCPRDTSTTAVVSGGTTAAQNYISSPTSVTNPTVFSIEIWFRTGTTIGGRLIGFGNAQTGTSTNYDRHIFMSDNGQLNFGVYPLINNTGTVKLITSPANSPTSANYADGLWHQAVGTLGSTGMRLYVDGVQVAADATVTSAQNYAGYWRVGWDTVNNWTNQPTNFNYRGSLAWASVYTSELSAALVKQHYAAGL